MRKKAEGDFSLDQLVHQSGEWLKGSGPDSDVVISSRVRLARNLSRFAFLTVAPPSVRSEIEAYIRDKITHLPLPKKIHYFQLAGLTPLDRTLLVERHLISREHGNGNGDRAAAITSDECVSIMVNEEDHLRMQVIRSGFQIDSAWDELSSFDNEIESVLHYAFHPKFGYVTCCPTNIGTGLRASVMLHLPALVFSKQVDRILQSMARMNYNIRGFFGEGTSPLGDFFQVSNQASLGRSETEIIDEMRRVIPEVLKVERQLREKLLKEQRERLEDKVWRAFGILTSARTISSEETMELLSALRLGINLGLINGVTIDRINEIFIYSQPSHLQKLHGRELNPAQRDIVRAQLIRQKLSHN